jgi:DNA-binding Lrp family transcriptional regulator
MAKGLSQSERKVLEVIQKGFPQSLTPYEDMAMAAGIDTSELLATLKLWKKEGKLRRIGAVVDYTKVGLPAAAMVVWKVEAGDVERVGIILAGFREVSHAYERQTTQAWPYNVYAMVHAVDNEKMAETIERMSRAAGVTEYRVLTTIRELKKAPPTYIGEQYAAGEAE